MPQGLPSSFQPITDENPDKNTGLPDTFQPLVPDAKTTPNPPIQPTQNESMLSRSWHALSDPITDLPSRFAKSVSDFVTTPELSDQGNPIMPYLKGAIGGGLQGVGDLVSGLTSPLNLATTAATMGEAPLLKAGYGGLAKIANIGAKALGAPVAIHGASQILSPETTLAEKGFGLTELAGGGAAMFHSPVSTTSGPKSIKTSSGETKVTGPEDVVNRVLDETHGPVISEPAKPSSTSGINDPYAKYREVPVGTKYTISPENMTRKKLTDSIKLGFEYKGLDENGKIIIQKVKESPNPKMPEPPKVEHNALMEAANIPRTLLASMDMSAPLRQGLGLIHKKAFWTSLGPMLDAFKSESAYQRIQGAITEDPIFQKRVTANGQIKPSFAEEAGLKLTSLNNMMQREESMMSSIAEKVPGVRPSNRAYTVFLNKLRADTFKQMTTDYGVFSGINLRNNVKMAKDIASFVNTASGRGDLGSLENSAKALSTVLFSPRLMASRIGMMAQGARAVFSPEVYMMSQPSVKREYLKSLFAIAAVGNGFTQLMRLGGGTVETDPASSDFGKAKIGDTRIDPYGGFQQMIVAAQRLMPQLDLSSMGLGEIGGKMKSSTSGREYDLNNPKFGQSDRMDVLMRFMRGKTNPIINFGWGLLAGSKEMSGKKMDFTTANPFENAIAQRFLPMLSQDIYDLINNETTPTGGKIIGGVAASLGMGSQTYGNK